MVEQRPFKALVVGSSPTQPTPSEHGLDIYSARLLWPTLYWIDRQFGTTPGRTSPRQQSHDTSFRRRDRVGSESSCRFSGDSTPNRIGFKTQKEPTARDSCFGKAPIEQPRKLSGLVVGSSPTQPTPSGSRTIEQRTGRCYAEPRQSLLTSKGREPACPER